MASARPTRVASAATAALLWLAAALAGIGPAAAGEGRPLLRVGTSGDYAPFSVLQKADPDQPAAPSPPSYSGFDIDLALKFASDSGYNVEFVPFRWPDLSRDLAAARFDVAMSGVTMKADRSVLGRFTVPVVATQAVALTWQGSGATTITDLNRSDRRIAVNAGGYLEGVARKVFPAARIIALGDNDAVRMALLDRWTDAVITDNLEEEHWTKGAVGVVRIAPLSDDRKAFLVRTDREDLALALDKWLLAREADGSLARLRREYLGEAGPSSPAVAAPLPTLITAIVERMSLMPLVWAAKQKAGLPIQDKDQEAKVLEGGINAVLDAARAASRPVPDAGQVRTLYKSLIESGKDIQGRLADQRQVLIRQARRQKEAMKALEAAGAQAAAEAAAEATTTGQEAAASAPADDDDEAGDDEAGLDVAPVTIPLFDLETQIRPAIARINAKLARALVGLDTPLSSEAVQKPLAAALADFPVQTGHVEAMSKAIASLSFGNARR